MKPRDLLALLPRPLLDLLETSERTVPRLDPGETDRLVARARSLRVAFVRQDIFSDLYCANPKLPGPELVRNSTRRTGPAGLLVDLAADYWIVREAADPECAVWTEKIERDPVSPDHYRAQRTARPAAHIRHSFAEFSVGVDEIPWEDYDLVVAMDVAVPYRILAKTRRPLWAYLPSDPGTPTAKRSLRKPPGNYDLALTHSFRRIPVRPGLGPRTVEFPYAFLRRKTWEEVFPQGSGAEKTGTMVEHQTEAILSPDERRRLESLGPLRKPWGSLPEVANSLNRSRFYFRCGGGPIVGNGLVEAVAAGCVAVGRKEEFVNRSLLCRSGLITSLGQGIKKMEQMNADAKTTGRLRERQGRLVDFYCFHRPLAEILHHGEEQRGWGRNR